jgi:DNA-binding transcriptional regulator YiaG
MDVRVGVLAERIGVQASTVARWENARRITPKAEARYLAGLATFGTIPTVSIETPEAA